MPPPAKLNEADAARFAALNAYAPAELYQVVANTIQIAIAGKPAGASDCLRDAIIRYCPEIHRLVERQGYRIEVDLEDNTHENLCKGVWFFILKPIPAYNHHRLN